MALPVECTTTSPDPEFFSNSKLAKSELPELSHTISRSSPFTVTAERYVTAGGIGFRVDEQIRFELLVIRVVDFFTALTTKQS